MKSMGLAFGVLTTFTFAGQLFPTVLASELSQVEGKLQVERRLKPTFDIRGSNTTSNTLTSGVPRNYQPNGWNILQDLGVNMLCVLGGIQGDVAHFNMNVHSDWAHSLDSFLSQANAHGIRIAFKELGNEYGTMFDIVAPQPSKGIVGTQVDSAKAMIDQLAGNNALRRNFITDPRIFGWNIANEVDLGDATTRSWCIAILDHIRSLGGRAYMSSPINTSLPADNDPCGVMLDEKVRLECQDFHRTEPILRGHADYLEIHMYDLSKVVQAIQNNLDVYQTMYNHFTDRIRNWMIEGRGAFPMNNLILGEFGMWHGKWTGWGGGSEITYDFDENTRNAYYRAVYQAAADSGIRNIMSFNCFEQRYGDSVYVDPAYGIVDTDGTYFTACTSVLQQYYGAAH